MPFEPVAELGTEAVAARGFPLDMMGLVRIGALAVVALILGLFVLRPILRPGRQVPLLPPIDPAQLTGTAPPPALGFSGAQNAVGLITDAEVIDPVTRLRRLIEERQDETAQILQSWIEEPESRERV